MKSRWILKKKFPSQEVEELKQALQIPEEFAQILFQRGLRTFDECKKFFSPTLDDLYYPYLMKDMDKAVERITEAYEKHEKILVYGDYDVDGTTAVACMFSFLKNIFTENRLDYYLPDRYSEGYGISKQGIEYAKENGFSLIIALDCGIKSIELVEYAKSIGVDFIICDHHLPGEELPKATAVLDPLREDCTYPCKYLSGCGVGFKLIQALADKFDVPKEMVLELLDLVAISIAADIVPILDENRIFSIYGMQQLETSMRPGIQVLYGYEEGRKTDTSRIVFGVAPKINAAGRIAHARLAVELLLAKNLEEAKEKHEEINRLNDIRKELDSSITQSAIETIKELQETERFTTVVFREDWHKGVLGIVASRLIEKYYRPTIVFTRSSETELVASARSIEGVNVYDALEKCSHLLVKFGGHKAAAGLTIEEKNFESFKAQFEEVVREMVREVPQIPTLEIDLELEFDALTPKFFRLIERLEPFGPGNMRPYFLTRNVEVVGEERWVGKDENHMKFRLKQASSNVVFDAVAFNFSEYYDDWKSKSKKDIVYSLESREWSGNVYFSLRVIEFR